MRLHSITPSRRVVFAVLLACGLAGAGVAHAECSPGQFQEAALAYNNVQPLLQAQNWEQAIPRLQSVVEICPEYAPALRGLGDAYLGNGQPEFAVRAYEQLIKVRGEEVEAPDYAGLAKAYATQKKYPEARAEYIRAQKLAPDDCGVLFNLGVLHMASGYYTQAVETLEHAEETCPQHRDSLLPQLVKACNLAADQQRNSGNSAQAQHYATLAGQYGGASSGSSLYNEGVSLMRQQKYGEAAQVFQKVVAESPAHANAWLSLARAQDAAGQESAAVESFRKYLELKPENLTEVASLVFLLAENGRCAEAQTTAAEAAVRHAGMGARALAPVHYAWGKALECSQQYQTARSKFAQAASSGDSELAARARQEMTRMDQFMEIEDRKKQRAARGD
ncbi:MAG: tetratricopeptide repeat protein [Candidatus Krumholzibacteriia bacterium]